MRNLFKCSHKKNGCFMGYEKCTSDCIHYGKCGDCKSWFLPYSQHPCNKCKYLKVEPSGQDGSF